jgi:hypothetical protein
MIRGQLYLKIDIVLLLLLDYWRLVSGPPIPLNYRMRAAKNVGRNLLISSVHRQYGLWFGVDRYHA